jgi:hypothetical protein
MSFLISFPWLKSLRISYLDCVNNAPSDHKILQFATVSLWFQQLAFSRPKLQSLALTGRTSDVWDEKPETSITGRALKELKAVVSAFASDLQKLFDSSAKTQSYTFICSSFAEIIDTTSQVTSFLDETKTRCGWNPNQVSIVVRVARDAKLQGHSGFRDAAECVDYHLKSIVSFNGVVVALFKDGCDDFWPG